MSELSNYVFEFLPSITKEQMAWFIGSIAVVVFLTRHDD